MAVREKKMSGKEEWMRGVEEERGREGRALRSLKKAVCKDEGV